MKTMMLDGVKIQEEELRSLLDSFWAVNAVDVVKNIQARLVDGKQNCYDLKIHYQGKLVLPFGSA